MCFILSLSVLSDTVGVWLMIWAPGYDSIQGVNKEVLTWNERFKQYTW